MEKRKTLIVPLPADTAERLREVKKIRSEQEGRRVTWTELFEDAIGNYIECAEKILSELETGVQDDGR